MSKKIQISGLSAGIHSKNDGDVTTNTLDEKKSSIIQRDKVINLGLLALNLRNL